jgi:methyltransferase (TIGR00027 family)
MRTGAGSDTAIFTALQRAAHQILDDLPRILDDPIAVGLSPGSSAEAIRERAAELQQPPMKVLRSSFVFRSRFTEDSLREAVDAGVRQFVVLGAGFDTFAYRQEGVGTEWGTRWRLRAPTLLGATKCRGFAEEV